MSDNKPTIPQVATVHTTKNIWSTMGNNDTLVSDSYENSNINPISEINNTFDFSSVSRGLGSISNKFKSAISFMKGVESALSSGSLIDKINGISGLAGSTLSKFGVDASSVLGYVGQATSFVAKANDVYLRVKNTNLSDFKALMELASDLTGMKEFLQLSDIATQAQYIVGLGKELAGLKIYGSGGMFKDIINQNPYKLNIVQSLVPEYVKTNDFSSIGALGEIVDPHTFRKITDEYMRNIGDNFSAKDIPFPATNRKWFEEIDEMNSKVKKTDGWHYYIKDPVLPGKEQLTMPNYNKDNIDEHSSLIHEFTERIIDLRDFIGNSKDFYKLLEDGCAGRNYLFINEDGHLVYKNINLYFELEDDKKYLILGKYLSRMDVKEYIRYSYPRAAMIDSNIKAPRRRVMN